MSYEYNHIRLPETVTDVDEDSFITQIDRSAVWGVFAALFGMANTERVIVTTGSIRKQIPDEFSVDHFAMSPTARPTEFRPLAKDGLYVIRTFNVLADHVDEFVELSRAAWETFETDDEFAAGPQGLFRPGIEREGLVPMQLFTWYDGLASWERSRTPDESARENFARRRLLTVSTSALATRLVQL